MTKKQHTTYLAHCLNGIAEKFGIILDKRQNIHWDEDHKEVYFSILELPSKNRVVRAMNAQIHVPVFMVLDTKRVIRFDIDSEVAVECHIDKFNKATLKRVEHYITQNYEYQDLYL